MRRWTLVMSVILTALLLLSVGGYAWSRWMALRFSDDMVKDWGSHGDRLEQPSSRLSLIEVWRLTPWCGIPGVATKRIWMPKRSFYEFFKRVTGQDLGNDPDAWETWFKAHPHLIWDDTLKQLVEPLPKS